GLCKAEDDCVGNAGKLLRLVDLRQHDLELVAAEPAHLSLVADDLGEPSRRLLQKLVAHRMAERIVDRLEAVEVEQQQRAGLRLAHMVLERALEQFGDVEPVRKARQRVVARELVYLALRTLLLGEIGTAPAKAEEMTKFVRDGMPRDGPPTLLARHRRL